MLMLDANVVIALLAGKALDVRDRFVAAVSDDLVIAISSIVMFELKFCIAKSARQTMYDDALRKFLSGSTEILAFDDDDAAVAGRIRAELHLKGTPIGPYDVMIAGHALRHGATLVTANIREFSRVDGLLLENWAGP
jgi:tRNA(fMet)-specific endonuclease VapC